MLLEITIALLCVTIIGFLWFNVLFSNVWMKYAHPGKTHEDLCKMGFGPLLYSICAHSVLLVVLKILMKYVLHAIPNV